MAIHRTLIRAIKAQRAATQIIATSFSQSSVNGIGSNILAPDMELITSTVDFLFVPLFFLVGRWYVFVHRTYIPRCSSSCAQARRPCLPSCSSTPLTHPTSCHTAQGTALAAARTRSREERTASILSTLASSRYDSVLNIHLC
jgi:hypothetical protein